MDNLIIATSRADAAAAEAVEQHHAQLAGALRLAVERVVAAAVSGGDGAEPARAALVRWCREELVPHALAEEKTMYPAAHGLTEGRLLVDGMVGEHEVIVRLVEELAAATEPVRAAAVARALLELFESHLAKENELVLPLLVAAADVSLAGLLEGMHDLLGGDAREHAGGEGAGAGAGHTCTCGEVDAAGYPELDARAVPHAIRHATIFGALDAVHPGGGLVLVAPHDPLPLLAQVEQRAPGAFEVSYLERGPEAWRLQLVRRDA
ncbi:uncharacterized protein (DUF2249 family)/iron-sulfur cluster repair protein YtfE (RIC family) [Nocardioides panaciterrulae]|uniref:Uncharacterized protein (DUF2249 family)/iron-sulfur cluster repair protein YtfE (RIC family) n=1 Tax=Nocardioides panaciterrulae TaxID=661492 RepID=A0A7Y9E4J4_9ACTN|nr:uncharacterized protein (DUF2249 family)/iron-sulfur cluster repair protein YtfE (RIC family) [Nocardioides panaciterrulae]